LVQEYQGRFDHEVLSGGMVRGDQVREIGGHEEAARLRESYQSIQSLTGARFGEAFFEGVAQKRRRLDSEPPAIALAAFRMLAPGRSELELAHAVLHGNFWEGGDPTSEEFYRKIAARLGLDPDAFVDTMRTPEAKDRALYDFALAWKLGSDALPRIHSTSAAAYLYRDTRGYSVFDHVHKLVQKVGA